MSKLSEHIEANILTAEDGHRYYWPSGTGMYAAHHLRAIADRLDELNGEWDYQIRKTFDALAAKQERLGAWAMSDEADRTGGDIVAAIFLGAVSGCLIGVVATLWAVWA